jgi:Leucine-rich repeat (LRR) protein
MATAAVSRRPQTSRTSVRTSLMATPATPAMDDTLTPIDTLSPTLPLSMPMAHMGFEGSRHLEPERLPSSRKERARTVRVIELNKDTIESIKQIADGIRRLDLSSLKLEELDEGLFETLVGLERLDIGFNCLTDEGIPSCFSKLENLIEFAAHYNNLTAVPKVLRKLKNITRLKIGHNHIKSMDGIERLKKLQVLVIENNEIEVVPREVYQNVKRLEMWHFSNNALKEVHSDIRLLRYLRDLDVSGNNLASLPPELFLLPRLEVLNASGNQITRIPTVNIKGNNRQHLAQVDLSDNQLIKFPEHLLLIAERVDLSKNKIKASASHRNLDPFFRSIAPLLNLSLHIF